MNVFTAAIATDRAAQKRVKAWVKALRSGKYKQASGVLRAYAGNFCCLGVACDLYAPAEWAAMPLIGHPLGDQEFTSGGLGNSTLGVKGRRLYRLSAEGQRHLAKLNDDGWPFKQIATRIDSDLREKLAA